MTLDPHHRISELRESWLLLRTTAETEADCTASPAGPERWRAGRATGSLRPHGELYVSDKCGSDQDGDGTQQKPFKTPLRALQFAGKEPFPVLYVDSQKEDERWAVISKTQMKNAKKAFNREQMKSDSKDKKEAEDGERREKNLEEAKKIVIQNDPSLPEGGCCVPSGG
ncbi:asparagine--tRNA ligase, cytoplasmic-like [Salarias fasciatus]|uniref:asparagine--tRNA ligase, cytoplasmic-like n=1 Tax=Salarias fasciatus TaxID=181472 RepID=UPI00117696DC|nr:asparagine--tRNA ligase, cytoplasmic-like [Salarias fasciatus]